MNKCKKIYFYSFSKSRPIITNTWRVGATRAPPLNDVVRAQTWLRQRPCCCFRATPIINWRIRKLWCGGAANIGQISAVLRKTSCTESANNSTRFCCLSLLSHDRRPTPSHRRWFFLSVELEKQHPLQRCLTRSDWRKLHRMEAYVAYLPGILFALFLYVCPCKMFTFQVLLRCTPDIDKKKCGKILKKNKNSKYLCSYTSQFSSTNARDWALTGNGKYRKTSSYFCFAGSHVSQINRIPSCGISLGTDGCWRAVIMIVDSGGGAGASICDGSPWVSRDMVIGF